MNEPQRVANLQSYHILHSEPAPEFDELVRLAAMVCDAPIAMVNLIDDQKQWCKAKVGTELVELPVLLSICAHAVAASAPLIISDATFDTRFSSHPMVTGPEHLRFYAGVPLISKEGFVLGTLCVLDSVPRQIDVQKLNLLKMLAHQTVALLERHRFAYELNSQKHAVQSNARLATLGRMAAAIVHEINNPLSILQARASMLEGLGKEGKINSETAAEFGKKMLETIRRTNKIIAGLSTALGNNDHEATERMSLKQIVEDTLAFSSGRFQTGPVEFEFDPPEESIEISCKPVQVSQVLLNLLNNAYDAASTGRSRRKWVKLALKPDADWIEIRVTDSGTPMPPEVARKIFTPFFTTKEVGKGTGLGLSIACDIVLQHGGTIQLDPESRNTSFVVRLPRRGISPAPAANH